MAIKNINVPDIGGAADVDVIEVLVKPGDTVKVDTPLITLESDKATMELPSPEAGVIKEIKVKAGSKVSEGTLIATIEVTGDAVSQEKTEEKKTSQESQSKIEETKSKEEITPPQKKLEEPISESEDSHAGPAVRRIAKEFGIDLKQVRGTGPKERILKEDLSAFIKSQMSQSAGGSALPAAPSVDFAKFGAIETQALTRIKKLSGKNLHRNWLLVPHVTQFGQADITELESFRQSKKSFFDKQGIKLTPLIFIMKAVVASLKAFPLFNSSLDANGENLILKKYFHIGVAVDTPEGLVVPVIRDVDKKSIIEIAKELGAVSEKARNKQLSSNEMQGGCFSISSLGGIGGTAFTPIVNVPEVAILGVSKAAHQPVYENDKFVPRLMLPLSLSYDHRVIDGAEGARFMVYLTEMLSDIRILLL